MRVVSSNKEPVRDGRSVARAILSRGHGPAVPQRLLLGCGRFESFTRLNTKPLLTYRQSVLISLAHHAAPSKRRCKPRTARHNCEKCLRAFSTLDDKATSTFSNIMLRDACHVTCNLSPVTSQQFFRAAACLELQRDSLGDDARLSARMPC